MTTPKRKPQVGDIWQSKDPRDKGLRITVIDVWCDSSHGWIRIQRFRKSTVSAARFHRDYIFVSAAEVPA
jgi:hypothetical protein